MTAAAEQAEGIGRAAAVPHDSKSATPVQPQAALVVVVHSGTRNGSGGLLCAALSDYRGFRQSTVTPVTVSLWQSEYSPTRRLA
jgi:hypothetical protein